MAALGLPILVVASVPMLAVPGGPAAYEPGASCVTSGCHGGFLTAASVHAPVAGEECSTCHEQEGDGHSFTATAGSQDLCTMCHEVTGEKNVHMPADDDCLGCHDPHSSEQKSLLQSEPLELCGMCHSDVVEEAGAMPVTHGALTSSDGCIGCHNPHSSAIASLLRAEGAELCMECHNRRMRGATRSLPNMKARLDENPHWHPPLHEGCESCHLAHASENSRLLQAAYPAAPYAPFDGETFGLCFMCHDESLVTAEQTTADTGFRDGERNLHWLHIAKSERGRSCSLCHDVHAGREEGLLAEDVPFGSWRLPINHERTDTGGSCQPGCHGLLRYDRNGRSG